MVDSVLVVENHQKEVELVLHDFLRVGALLPDCAVVNKELNGEVTGEFDKKLIYDRVSRILRFAFSYDGVEYKSLDRAGMRCI